MAIPDSLELLATDVINLSAPGIAATNRVRIVLFERLFSHLTGERAEPLFTILSFEHDSDCYIITGYPTRSAAHTAKEIEKVATDFGGMCLTAKCPIDNSTAVVASIRLVGTATSEAICNTIAPSFAADRLIALGPQRTGADGVMCSIQTTLYCLQTASALAATAQPPPRPSCTNDALLERALIGDADVRDKLACVVYGSLIAVGPDDLALLAVSTFLKFGGSPETTVKELNVHPNTIRYRLKRIAESTGWDVTDPREAYVLTTAIALGRVAEA